MTVKNLTDKSADLYIYGEIVDNTDWKWDESDVMPDDVKEVLESVEGLETLNIYVNSPGGSVFAGLGIYNMLKRNKAYKTAYIDGVGASMASVIPFAANKVFMPSNSFLMIHKPLTIAIGNASDFRKLAEDLDTIESGLVDIYKANLQEGVDIETIKQMMEEETWLTGEEAAKYFNVEVIESKNIAACASDLLNKYNKTPQKLLAQAGETKGGQPPEIPKPEANEDEYDKIKFQNELDLLEL
ncbi:head maturation protease, ClpP-related [Virgibacillus ndiopensis]|uniref:head maturation protease, ClpP-related n=1 Tax=Virgibacillus ndiopensis TaxID=2004408 RepID=UPI000C0760F8|nr:head maturation protease, ClpP-related [Virgibacillus ndiopensis]